MNKELTVKLSTIQRSLNAPKTQYNKFGKFPYRNCEDILQAVKPLLKELVILITDEVQMVGDRIYVKSTATITDGDQAISCSAYARESEEKKGMDDSQITGTASSYARKYTLNGLLLIDDNKDADSSGVETKTKHVESRISVEDYKKLSQDEVDKLWPTLSESNQQEILNAFK